MTDVYRVYVELPNGGKIRAQGDVSEVRADVETFYSKLLGVPKPTAPIINGAVPHNDGTVNGVTPDVAEASAPMLDAIEQPVLDRLFSKDRHGTVALRALPRGDNAAGDALIALIYGAGRLANEQQVTGSRLMKAALQSGLKLDRIDRVLTTEIGPHVTTAGFKKGRRYGLTNPGIRRAEDVLRGILG